MVFLQAAGRQDGRKREIQENFTLYKTVHSKSLVFIIEIKKHSNYTTARFSVFYTRIQDVPMSNFDRLIGYPEREFAWFLSGRMPGHQKHTLSSSNLIRCYNLGVNGLN
jgi:hypothetical protein